MGILDDLFWNVGPDLPSLVGRRAGRVLSRGEAATATVAGIEVERSTEDTVEPEYRYALDVRTGAGTTRVGVRQRIDPNRGDAALGATVPVKVLGDRVVIELGRRIADEVVVGTWRMVDPPAEGVRDRWRTKQRKRIDAAEAGTVTVLSVAQGQSAFGPTENLDIDVRLEPGGETRRIGRELPPDYARALVTPGAVLPVGIDEGGARITIDWEAAANRV